VSFIAGKNWAMVRPNDVEPGYILPDSKGAEPASARLGMSGAALPGPDNSHLWLETDRGYRLVDVQGRPAGPFITIPDDLASTAEPDGTGYLLVSGPNGVYAANRHAVRRFTSGTLLAAGPTRWLVDECGDHDRCQAIVIDRRSGSRRVLSAVPAHPGQPTFGAISPDGTTAALLESDRDGGGTVHLIDLISGRDLLIQSLGQTRIDPDTRILWSPDSRWIFVGAHGSLHAVQTSAGIVHDLGVPLPPVDQLAIRQ